MTRKEEKDAELLSQIKSSAVRQGKSLLYSDLENKSEADATGVVGKKLIPQIKKLNNFNFVIIDASRIGRWKPEHPMWPTWEKNSTDLTDAAQNTPMPSASPSSGSRR